MTFEHNSSLFLIQYLLFYTIRQFKRILIFPTSIECIKQYRSYCNYMYNVSFCKSLASFFIDNIIVYSKFNHKFSFGIMVYNKVYSFPCFIQLVNNVQTFKIALFNSIRMKII